jgi:exodeoxyribonuclease VII small subunit
MNEKFQFEKALEDLEKIVEAMESGELTLDQALKKYEEGVGLVRACQSKLIETEKKIEILTRTLDGSLKKEAFDPEKPRKVKKA